MILLKLAILWIERYPDYILAVVEVVFFGKCINYGKFFTC